MTMWMVLLGGILPWLFLFGAAVYLIRLWKKPGAAQLRDEEVKQLREEVSLMRDFLRDAMERISRLEEERRLEESGAPGEHRSLEAPGRSAASGRSGEEPGNGSSGDAERRAPPGENQPPRSGGSGR